MNNIKWFLKDNHIEIPIIYISVLLNEIFIKAFDHIQ